MSDEMEAGRTLDERIAVEVMGLLMRRVPWHGRDSRGDRDVLVFSHPAYPDEALYSYDPGSNAMMFRNGRDDSAGIAGALPEYSEDISAAWEVVEKLIGTEGDKASVWLDALGFTGEEWRVIVGHEKHPYTIGEAATAPLAICKAALQALAPTTPSKSVGPEPEDR